MLNRKTNYSKYMHETKQRNVKNGFYIDITSDVKVGESLCSDPRQLLQAPACSFSFSDGGNGPKGALNGESSSRVS